MTILIFVYINEFCEQMQMNVFTDGLRLIQSKKQGLAGFKLKRQKSGA